MNYFIDAAYNSLVKDNEELCGDNVAIVRMADFTIIVLADGLGSGVKANILSTLTSRIASTMLKEGADIYETVDTIVNTLPVCKIRNLAYSTFTIVKVFNNGNVYIAEYDNPPFVLIRNGESLKIDKRQLIINNKIVNESSFTLNENDELCIFSDGVIHAGLGEVLNLGWTYNNVEKYLLKCIKFKTNSQEIANDLLDVCWNLYNGKPGDDTTVVSIKIIKPKFVDLFTGPPLDKSKDTEIIKKFMNKESKKVICGGTAANIASRELKCDLNIDLSIDSDLANCPIPPTASMDGVDLITEGVITLSKTIEMLNNFTSSAAESKYSFNLNENNGASRLAKLLIEDCTHLTLWVGNAINHAHQNPDFPSNLSIKLKLVNDLCDSLTKLGKIIHINYI